MSDRACKFCGADIRWCRDDAGRWLPLDLNKIPAGEPRAEYLVIGAEDARRVAKANRARFAELYRRHTCEQGENARAMRKRIDGDRREVALARRQLAFERETLPDNVEPMRNWRKR